ncbi:MULTISPECIES: hypothetical protein [Streptomyces]|uniref:hypothetical protein n=1 Tax=Streptomyces TaxID=1883 RepID=UPI0022495C30|nr:hypothetical protein [Streptomyces sp. JHD 1]MCX2967837.1 hypothetical protein [Streptomyces sp. JHD 1]
MRTLSPPVHLALPVEDPQSADGCDVCAALVRQRDDARARGDLSAVTDLNVEIRAHHTGRRRH